jgi:hypothetical protein
MFSNKQKQTLIEQLKKTPVIQLACEKLGVSRATFYRWRKDDAEFNRATEEAINEGSNFINDIAESQLMNAIKDRNMTAIIFWLKAHHPAYGNRIELSGKLFTQEELTPEQEATIRKALEIVSDDKSTTAKTQTSN